MALLGSSVDPRLFMQDYSGFTRAAETQAQGMQNLGAAIGQGIKSFGEAREERKKLDAQVKADDVSIESAIKLGKSLGIDINSYLEPIQALRKDPNTTPAQSLALGRAAAQGISNAFTLGIGAQERQSASERARAEAQYKQGMLEASQTRAAASLLGAQQKASEIKSEEVPVVNAVTGEKDSVLINRDAQGRMRDPETGKVIKDIFKYGNEMEGWEAPEQPAMPTPTSQVGGSISDSIASAAEMNIGKLSTAKTPGTQGGNMGCADAICRTFEMATGEELVPGGTLSTREMATNLNNDPRFVKVPFNEAKKGDIVLTPRKGNKAGHTGIVLDGGKIASNSSKGFAGKSPGTFTQNYTMDSWGRNVAPRNPSETAAYRYVGSQGIDNALAMGGDISSQAMGTPEQQAEAASQIEQGQQLRLATAQNISQGAIPTEPSMATQQPQLPQQTAPQVNKRLLSSRSQNKPTTTMSAEQVKNLTAQGFKVDAVPTNDGNFMVSGVTAGGQTPRYTKTPQEDLESQRLTRIDKEQSDLASAGLAESQNISQLKGIKDLLDSSVKTGFGREVIMKAKRVIGADVANEEQFQSLVGNEAMKNIALTKGAISDREMEYFKTVLSPNMGKTTEGNKRIIDFKIKYAERSSKIAKTITKMQSQGESPYKIQEQVDNIIASEPLFSPSDANAIPQNQAESDANFLEGYQRGE
jgi:hypothetical protein